ncbi:hypothetical protein C8Q76DRAFT_241601 [Earliella scabrosa]|nr:hypothetical protein C8Q76DRAFT_241601 [Earliella scabrosa]
MHLHSVPLISTSRFMAIPDLPFSSSPTRPVPASHSTVTCIDPDLLAHPCTLYRIACIRFEHCTVCHPSAPPSVPTPGLWDSPQPAPCCTHTPWSHNACQTLHLSVIVAIHTRFPTP